MTAPAALQAASAFYQNAPGLRALRWIMSAAQRVWPELAVRVAYRLFGTPLPLRLGRRRARWGADWQVARWPFEGAEVTLYRPRNASGPTALLVHGWGGHARQMRDLAEALAAQGLSPVLLEMPAHGRSRGRVSNLPQFARALAYVTTRLQSEGEAVAVVVAHSLAANAAAHAASQGVPLGRLVLLAPPASPIAFTRVFAHMFGLTERTRAALQQRIEEREGVRMHDFEPQAVGPRVAVPTLVVHDRCDRINRFADGVAFRDAIAGARLLATDGLGHSGMLRAPAILRAVAAFADRGLVAPAPAAEGTIQNT